MEMKNKIRPIVLALATVVAGLLAYGLWTLPKAQPADAEGFSAARVVKDIEVISKEHHSVAQPEERAAVREYLVKRLNELGADTVKTFTYDSLTGPLNKHVKYTFDVSDVLAEFAPENATDSTSYLMFVAHYDSRFSQPMPKKDTVWSYGAADDGYGLGIILETVSQALKQRQDWNQGIKVLFTDAEEAGMLGMKSIWEQNKEEFDNVGFMINIEARGPKGPALLFETSPGNTKVMDLYAEAARYPYTYSLTTVVYQFMPNFTDFKVVKNDIPGMNFSTVADINHYHTDKDNYENVNEKSIQHYGAQILPVTMEYLTDLKYADRDYLKADKDTVNFTVPVFGLVNCSKIIYIVINFVLFFMFFAVFAIENIRGRLKSATGVLKVSAITFGAALGALLVGELIAYLASLAAGAKFSIFGTVQGVKADNAIMIVSVIMLFFCCLLVYWLGRRKAVRGASTSMRSSAVTAAASHYAYRSLYGTLSLMFLLSIVLLFAIGENLMFFIPLFCATSAMILYHLTSWKFWMPIAMVMILLHAFSFLYALAMALTIGAFGAVMMLALLDFMVLIPLSDLYLMPNKK